MISGPFGFNYFLDKKKRKTNQLQHKWNRHKQKKLKTVGSLAVVTFSNQLHAQSNLFRPGTLIPPEININLV